MTSRSIAVLVIFCCTKGEREMIVVLTVLGIGMLALAIVYLRTDAVVGRRIEALRTEAERELRSLKVKR